MNWLKKWFAPKRCYICNQTATKPQAYLTDQGETVRVCYKCIPYAERRALRKP